MRSIPLVIYKSLFDIKGIKFYSLQKGEAAKEIKDLKDENIIADFTDQLQDFSDTASLIENLDLIITVDTAVAHLAGAMGKPVWTLLPYAADWRWLLDREDSPWYPTMRLFRQPALGDWESVMARLASNLAEYRTR
jgi:ADP-heptose:LPS heptosyltransferase